MKGYHATSSQNAIKILQNEFIINDKNDSQWLGKGIYFFVNLIDSKSWAKKHHHCGRDPAIIECELETKTEGYLDLDDPQQMNAVYDLIDKYEELLYENDKSITFSSPHQKMNFMLNVYKKEKNIEIIKYTFHHGRTQRVYSYKKPMTHYMYNEVQVCATDNNCIVSKKMLKD